MPLSNYSDPYWSTAGSLGSQVWGGGGAGGWTQIDPAVLRPQAIDPMTMRQMQEMMLTYTTYSGDSGKSEDEKNKVAVKVLDKIKKAAHAFSADEKNGEAALDGAAKYRKLGLVAIAEVMEKKANKVLKELAISMAGYKRINRSELKEFQKELDKVSDSKSKRKLIETPLQAYIGQGIDEGTRVEEKDLAVPPAEVLEKLGQAQDSKLFDAFSVLHVKYVPDPILCGKINESEDLYFIAEWGDDVKLSDIVK